MSNGYLEHLNNLKQLLSEHIAHCKEKSEFGLTKDIRSFYDGKCTAYKQCRDRIEVIIDHIENGG